MRQIDADALKESLKTPIVMNEDRVKRLWEGWHECTIAVDEAINKAPTIEKHSSGTWEPKETQNVPYGIILECSCCGWETLVNDALYFKYCPNCGSKMVI